MNIKTVKLKDIIPAEYNPRKELNETDYEYKALKASIDEFGFVTPLIINERTNRLISGNQRLKVLISKGCEEAEAVIVNMEPEKEKALCVAMNKISGKWDYGKLADILEELEYLQTDMLTTGFSYAEISELLGELEEIEPEEIELEDIETPEVQSVDKKEDSKQGVLCLIGEYKFRVSDKDYNDMMADIREKVGFSKEAVEKELKRRLFGECC